MAKKYMVAILTGDNHLQDRAWSSRTTLEHDTYWAFDYMTEYAAKNKIPAIIAAGDIIDKQKNESDIANFVREQMQFCEDNEIDFFFIQGQHEMQTIPWLNAVHRWPKHLTEDTAFFVGEFRFRVHGIDWTPQEQLQERLDEVDEAVDLLVMHQVCSEWMGSITTPELHWNMVSHAKQLLVGDYHGKHETIVTRNRQNEKMRVFCPGSQALQAVNEPPVKHFFVLWSDGSSTSHEIPSRPFIQPPDLMSESDVDAFVENVETACQTADAKARVRGLWEEVCKPIVYVRYQYDIPDAFKRIDRAVGESGHFFHKELRPKPTEEDLAESVDRKKIIEGGLVGALDKVITADEDEDVYNVAKQLLETRDLVGTMSALREEYLSDETEAS
jgi:hypothetical protein